MTLYLTSDEKFEKLNNTRTSFSNHIGPEFFQSYPFNLALKDIHFDPKFPTLANFNQPHVITMIDGKQHNLNEFPLHFQKMSTFQDLFVKQNASERAYMRVVKEIYYNEHVSDTDCKVMIEIHPRLNIAFSMIYLKDITLNVNQDIVQFVNSTMFPFHKIKPLSYDSSGLVEIKSNLEIYFSDSMLKLLGFIKYGISDNLCSSITFPPNKQYLEHDLTNVEVHSDALARIESKSSIYTKYRELMFVKPKGEVKIVFKLGNQLVTSHVRFNLDMFNLRENRMFIYEDVVKTANSHMLKDFLSIIEKYVLDLEIDTSESEIEDLKQFLNFLFKERKRIGFHNWGGLVSMTQDKKQLKITKFHTKVNKIIFKKIESRMNKTKSELISSCFREIFYNTIIKSISFNPVLCDLFGIVHDYGRWGKITTTTDNDILMEKPMDYFKAKRGALDSTLSSTSFFLQIMKLQNVIKTSKQKFPLKLFSSSPEDLYLLSKGNVFFAEREINRNVNAPKLIYISCNFSQHSLFGGEQRQILNFFPFSVSKSNNNFFSFKNPIILKATEGVTYHINLLDENLAPLKADIGVPTLLTLKRSRLESMFPVSLLSSDKNNKILYPSNQSNSFKNKLAFPLLFSDRKQWSVSLHSIAFPKIKNIFPQYCKFTVCNPESQEEYVISIDSCYVTNISTLLSMLNQSIHNTIKDKIPNVPVWRLKDGYVELNTNKYDVKMEGDMLKLLGFFYSYQHTETRFSAFDIFVGVSEPLLSLFQPQELIVLTNIVEEAFYAQRRPSILRVLSVAVQDKFSGYNYIQIEEPDKIALKVDRVDEIEITIVTRKGKLVEFVDDNDVRLQLQFQQQATD